MQLQKPMCLITKSDIIGARIVAIHGVEVITKAEDGHPDSTFTALFFTVDRGFSFVLPVPGLAWSTEKVPPEAKLLEDIVMDENAIWRWLRKLLGKANPDDQFDAVRRIKQQTIAGVYSYQSSMEPSLILFEDGSQMRQIFDFLWGGRPDRRPFLFRPTSTSCTPRERLTDFFEVPLEPGK